jgi:hypothetical protein
MWSSMSMEPDRWPVNELCPTLRPCLSPIAALIWSVLLDTKGAYAGEVIRTRTTMLQAHTHQWMGTYGGPGNGNYQAELARCCQVATRYATTHQLLPSQILIRLDGEYGNAAVLTPVLTLGLGLIVRCREYGLLERAEVRVVLACPPARVQVNAESGVVRSLYDCPALCLTTDGPPVRLLITTHPVTTTSHRIGKKRDGLIYELFLSTLPSPALSAKDVLDL